MLTPSTFSNDCHENAQIATSDWDCKRQRQIPWIHVDILQLFERQEDDTTNCSSGQIM